jgi:glutathione S-transferase
MAPKISLYTAHHCPFAHRSQIALRELGLEFETVLVNITIPRTAQYLAINPRGLVPALAYDGHVLTESGLISQFLVDSHPSHLLKSSSEPGGAEQRFSIGFFVETYFSNVHPFFDAAVYSSGDEKITEANKYVNAVVKHIEPLLDDAAPFFGGSRRLTLAEVYIGFSRFPTYRMNMF